MTQPRGLRPPRERGGLHPGTRDLTSRRVDFRYLAIEGPPGLGKTALAERLAARLDADGGPRRSGESVPRRLLRGRSGAAFQAQLFFTLGPPSTAPATPSGDLFSQTTICDYLFERDRIYAFVNLDDNELFIYQRLYDLVARDLAGCRIWSSTSRRPRGDAEAAPPRARQARSRMSRRSRRRVSGRTQRGIQPFLLSLRRDAAAGRRDVADRPQLGRSRPWMTCCGRSGRRAKALSTTCPEPGPDGRPDRLR